MKDFSEQLKQVPETPGVYLMFNAQNQIIYVGKAINLRRRVRSYFTASNHGKTPKVLAMVENVDHFEYIIVKSEVEALVLESNFIKEHAPKYNILLRDDKQYPYICISHEKFPRLLKVRQVKRDGGVYFGPFPNAYAVNDTIRFLQRIFGIRTCSLNFDQGQRLKRPCLNYYIGQCPAPCADKADEAKYLQGIEEVAELLKGNDQSVRRLLTQKMQDASDALQFERAATYRDQLLNLDALQERQKVTFSGGKDADVIAMARGAKMITVQVFFVRGGKVVDREHFQISDAVEESTESVFSSFLKQFYWEAPYIPGEILLEAAPDDIHAIEQWLTDKRGKKVSLIVPKRGDKSALVTTAHANAEEELIKAEAHEQRKERNVDRGVKELERILGVPEITRVESYDISNISGVQNVGSMVVFSREKKQPKEYRKFRIRTVEGPDEYASQREMLERRIRHGAKDREEGRTSTGFGALPSLILMDGGKGQVHLAEEILQRYQLEIPVVGMVKDDKHTTRALFYQGKTLELERHSALYKYLYAIQEEVHRFAIEYHRKLREKDMVSSELDNIPGIGKKRRTELLRKFKTVEAVRRANVEELMQTEGMNKRSAEAVFRYFRLKEGEASDTTA